MENKPTRPKPEKISAVFEEFLKPLINADAGHIDIETDAGHLVGLLTLKEAGKCIADFFANMLCGLHAPDLYPEFGGDKEQGNPEVAAYLAHEIQPVIMRAWEVYAEEVGQLLTEAIAHAPMIACIRALCDLEQQTGIVVSRDLSELEDIDEQSHAARLERWGVKNHRKPGTFETWREFLAACGQAAEGLEPDKITQPAIAERIGLLGGIDYSPRQLQRDIEKFGEFGLRWKRRVGVVKHDNIQ